MLFNVVLPAACFVVSRRLATDPQKRRWATYAWMTGTLILVISVLSTIGMPFAEQAGFPVVDGLIQRVLISMGWIWLALTALRLLRETREALSDEASTRITQALASTD